MKKFLKKLYLKLSPTYKMLTRVEQKLRQMEERQISIARKMEYIDSLSSYYHDLVHRLDYYYSHLAEQQNKAQQLSMNSFWMLNPVARNIKDVQCEFWKSFPHAVGDMAIIQSCNLWLMLKFKRICEENGLLFWLHGGTLIGAIRHQGFIPWDDDVDCGMLRDDLEKLIQLTRDTEYKVFVYYHDDETFSRGYQFKLADESLPVFIDIFVFDSCFCSSDRQMADMQSLYNETRIKMVNDFLSLPTPLRVIDVGYYRFGPFSSGDAIIADSILEQNRAKLGSPECGNCLYYGLENYPFPYKIMRQNVILPTRTVLFEGETFEVPYDYDTYLEAYNDYWQMPKDFGIVSPHGYWYKPQIDTMKAFLSDLDNVEGE